ncbi:hypothetical protein NliqN6_5840 [Naganishia liquefaciens]|uniref:ABC transporter domain-containing protein n=1 Tax=Naganishia liquefaciens TaxID=104408 RepID=A0A8H3YHK1_9TREE|nr:hypothetical protein NliqN6_5840 [Naganishia liquefaciens]
MSSKFAITNTVSFSNLSYTVKSKKGGSKKLTDDVSLHVQAGEMVAIMGPSGSGKSTLLDLMSGRKKYDTGGMISLNGQQLTSTDLQNLSSFVEQEDALLGTLTARETLSYALRLTVPKASKEFVEQRVQHVLEMLGLQGCADIQIGTPLRRGLSGGQKRRVSIGCSLVTYPRILYLDEPTSGLDSTAAKEVIAAVGALAKQEKITVLASIHQPSYQTLNEFTDLVLLSKGTLCYRGKVEDLESFLLEIGVGSSPFVPPTDTAMQILNTDFATDTQECVLPRDAIQQFRTHFLEREKRAEPTMRTKEHPVITKDLECHQEGEVAGLSKLWWHSYILAERMLLNYSRNLLAFGIRAAMYAGMGLMLATIWIHLGTNAGRINDRLAVHFYSVAFLAFMSVAGIPGFLEERANFRKESANGLYTALPFVLANSVVTLPFLVMCSTIFVLIMYWGIGLHPGAAAVFRYIGFLSLSIYVAESQVQLIAAFIPIFVAALAISAFLNGFWMSLSGFFLKAVNLPRFWYYSFHWMDYQTYAFELIANSDLRGLMFRCEASGCPYPSSIGPGMVSGYDVLDDLGIGGINYGAWCGILVGILVLYRVALWMALKLIR